MTIADALVVLWERYAYLDQRIQAKRTVRWETNWDERERHALGIALRELKDRVAYPRDYIEP